VKTLLLCVYNSNQNMDTLVQIAQIIFILSVLVVLHEFGHFIPAKLFKVKVEKFYLFMDAGFSLFKKKIKDTEWGIGWLPIGGYVKLAGMIDESMDKEQLKQAPQPWEFRSKPAWQRLIIMLGGITVNIILAWFIYTIMYSTVGQKYISTEKIQENGLSFGKVGLNAGFQNGDKIVSVDGKLQPKFNWLVVDVLLSEEIVIDRNGETVKLKLNDDQIKQILGTEGKGFIKTRTPLNLFYVDSVHTKNGVAFQEKDLLLGINDLKLEFYDELNDSLKKNINKEVTILVSRNGQEVKVPVKVTKKFSERIDSITTVNVKTKFKDFYIKDVVNDGNQGILLDDDKITGVKGQTLTYYDEFKDQLELNKGKKVTLSIERNNKPMTVDAVVDDKGKLGIQFNEKKMNDEFFITNKMSFSEAVSASVKESWMMFVYNIKQFKLILKPKTQAYKQVKSPIGITRQLPTSWDWEYVWNFTAMFSIGLAFMNLLPIPGLDGGHALFTIAEMVTGRTLSEKAMGYVQTGGMIFLLSLMALTFGKDIYEIIVDNFFKKV
jgi:RIP metalloprotease RseP